MLMSVTKEIFPWLEWGNFRTFESEPNTKSATGNVKLNAPEYRTYNLSHGLSDQVHMSVFPVGPDWTLKSLQWSGRCKRTTRCHLIRWCPPKKHTDGSMYLTPENRFGRSCQSFFLPSSLGQRPHDQTPITSVCPVIREDWRSPLSRKVKWM